MEVAGFRTLESAVTCSVTCGDTNLLHRNTEKWECGWLGAERPYELLENTMRGPRFLSSSCPD